jgi:site-specific recombinase XerD
MLTSADAERHIADYVGDAQAHLRAETLATYRKKLQAFLEWWRAVAPTEPLSAALARQYDRFLRHRLAQREISKRSYGLYLTPVRQWGLYLLAEGLLEENPFLDVHGPGLAKGLTHGYLTLPQVKAFLGSFQRSEPRAQRDYALCYLMLKTAVWPIELERANVGDLDEVEGQTVLYLYRKGTDDRTDWVVLLPEVLDALHAYLRSRESALPKDPLFATMDRRAERRLTSHEMRRLVVQALRRAGLKRISISGVSLRHTAAMQALRNQAPLEKVQRLLRHRSIKTTQVYQEQLKDVRPGAERYLKY